MIWQPSLSLMKKCEVVGSKLVHRETVGLVKKGDPRLFFLVQILRSCQLH